RAPSAHNIGAVQSYDWSLSPLFISAGCVERIRAGTASELKSGHSAYLDDIFPVFVHDEVDRNGMQYPPTDAREFSEMPVFVSSEPAPFATPSSRGELWSSARVAERADAEFAHPDFAVVLFAGSADLTGFLASGEGAPLRLHLTVLPNSSGLRSGRAEDAK